MIDQWVEEALRQALESPGTLRVETRGRGPAQNLLKRLAQRGGRVGKFNLLARESATGTRQRYFMHGVSAWGGSDEHQRDETYAAMLARHQDESAFYTAGTDLVGWWRMEEASGTIADSSGNGNTATPTGCTYRQSGIESYSLSWDGVDDVIAVADATELQNVFDGGGGLDLWIKPVDAGEGGDGLMITKRGSTANGWRFSVRTNDAGFTKLRFIAHFSTTAGQWTTTASVVPFGVWTHVALNYNADATTNDPVIYVNSASVALTEDLTPVGTRVSDVGESLRLGNAVAGNLTFNGSMDEVAVWTRSLTAEEIRAHYYVGRLKLGLVP